LYEILPRNPPCGCGPEGGLREGKKANGGGVEVGREGPPMRLLLIQAASSNKGGRERKKKSKDGWFQFNLVHKGLTTGEIGKGTRAGKKGGRSHSDRSL